MIFVTLGTNDKQFIRLLDACEKAIEEKVITDRVVVQAGFTKYESKNMEIFDYMDRDQFSTFMNSADLVITHGGVGTIMTALKERKKILAAARLSEYHEHVNDHQIQLLTSFEKEGYSLVLDEDEMMEKDLLMNKLEELKSKKSELIMNMEKSTAKNGVDAIIDIIMKSIC